MNEAERERTVMQTLRREIMQFRSEAAGITDTMCATIQTLLQESEQLLNTAKRQRTEADEALQAATKRCAMLEGALDEKKQELSAAEHALPLLEDRCERLEPVLDSLDRRRGSLQDQLSYAEDPEERADIREQLTECCDRIGHVQSQLHETEQEIAGTKQQIVQKKGEVSAQTQEKDEAYQQKHRIYQKYCFYDEKVTKQERLYLELQEQCIIYMTVLRETASNTSNTAGSQISALDGCIDCIDQYIGAI